MNTKQVIVIRKDLNMRKGKAIAQGCHASIAWLGNVYRNKEELTKEQQHWMDGNFRKVCLYVESEEELKEIHREAIEAGLTSTLVMDDGLTEFNGVKTLTCCAIGPHEDIKIDAITIHLKLY